MEISDELRKLVDPNNECCCEHCLSNKCKEWAHGLGWYVVSGLRGTGGAFAEFGRYEYDDKYADSLGRTNTEPEAIFKACEYILNNKEK